MKRGETSRLVSSEISQRIEIRRDGLALIPRGDEQCEFDFDFLKRRVIAKDCNSYPKGESERV